MKCPSCNNEVFDIDVRCAACGVALGATGAHRMVGTVVLGQYELVDVLGQGGMSIVFKGRHQLTEQEVALKILPPELAAHSQVKSRFLEEAKALAALDHPNIVHLYNFGQEENGCFVLAMQYVQGRTWERLILERDRLDWSVSARICIDVLRALEYAHGRGVVHRDMKPSNVLVRVQDGSATVMDFGIAKMTTSTRLTATGQTMGTVRYMSPEQVRGQEVDFRTDIYSLGATLYESLTGLTPFEGATHFDIMTKHLNESPRPPSSLGVVLPRTIEDAVMRCLAKRAGDRFEAARPLRKLLEQALRESDLGLVETQRLSRDLLSAPPRRDSPDPAGAPPGLPLMPLPHTTAANAVPSGESRPAPRRRLGIVALAIGGTALVAGGIAAGVVMTRGGSAYHPIVKIEGAALTAGQRYGALLVETDGAVSPGEVESIYRNELTALRRFVAAEKPDLAIPDPVREIVAMPRGALCLKSNWLTDPPKSCASSPSAALYGPQRQRRMFVISDPAKLVEAIRRGVAQAACELNPDVESAPGRDVCALAERYVDASLDTSRPP